MQTHLCEVSSWHCLSTLKILPDLSFFSNSFPGCFFIICDVFKRGGNSPVACNFSFERLSLSHTSSVLSSHINPPLCWKSCTIESACADCSDAVTGSCVPLARVYVRGSYERDDAVPDRVHKCGWEEEEEGERERKEERVSGWLTGWLLESFGRVDDHMQKAVQARSLLIWKARTAQLSQVPTVGTVVCM